jgi:hypothetical protein
VANNNYPQITSVTSEALQAQIRNLLPSQEGFGTDLMAQNVIVPVIDLTAAAEGSSVGENLQTALAFGSQTAFNVQNTTTTLMNSTGFWRLTGCFMTSAIASANPSISLSLTDGLATKKIFEIVDNQDAGNSFGFDYDKIIFLAAGESLSCTSAAYSSFIGSYRQIADVNGALVNPSGFTPQ